MSEAAATAFAVVAYEPRHAEAWRSLNEAWLTELFAIEPKDRKVLDDPEGQILARGGRIFIAELDGRAVGCCALIAMADRGVELAKMAADRNVRGRGVGKALLDRALAEARAAGAPRVFLESNARCEAAVALYEAAGFRHLEPHERPATEYARADVFMELRLRA